MATCTSVRVSYYDFTTINSAGPDIGASIYDPDRLKIYFVYCEQYDVGSSDKLFPHAVYFREYDPIAETFLDPVELAHAAYPEDTIHVEIKRLDDADHTLVVVWGGYEMSTPGYRTRSRESTDNGVTWASEVTVDPPVNTRQFVTTASDGTSVYAFCYSDGSGATGRELWVHNRTGASTWDTTGVKVYDGHGNNYEELPRNMIGADYHAIAYEHNSTDYILYVGQHHTATGPDQTRVVCFRSLDDGATWTEILIKDYGVVASLPDMFPQVKRGPDGTVWAVWTDYQDQPNTYESVTIARSDDDGATWTVVGTPVLSEDYVSDTTNDGWGNRSIGFAVDQRDGRLYLATFFGSGSTWTYNVIRSDDIDPSNLDDWEVFHTCDFSGVNEQNRSDMFFVDDQLFYLFNENVAGLYRVSFLVEDVPFTPDIPTPPLITPSPSGSDAPNVYLRLRHGENRGWSAHDLTVACWSPWPEGDTTTERRLPILLAGNSNMDLTADDPGNITAIWKLDDPSGYGRRVKITRADGETDVRYDPFKFQLWTKAYPLVRTSGFNQGILRGLLIQYRRPSASFVVETWIDGVLAQTDELEASGPDYESMDQFPVKNVFLPINTDDNLGFVAQFRITDETLYPLVIEILGLKYIDKKVRG